MNDDKWNKILELGENSIYKLNKDYKMSDVEKRIKLLELKQEQYDKLIEILEDWYDEIKS